MNWKIIRLFIWFLITIISIDVITNLITQSDTGMNFLGLIILFIYYLVSYKTKCFTILNFKRK